MPFVDVGTHAPPPMSGWEPIVVKRAAIEAEIARLADAPRPANGVRAARIAHPSATDPGFGLSPGIDVTLAVLHPGEETTPRRSNASEVSLCLRGRGQARIGRRRFAVERGDVWNTPGMHPTIYRNDGDDLLVRLSYSNGALLRQLRINFLEDMPPTGFSTVARDDGHEDRIGAMRALAEPIPLGADGAQLLTYEHLIAPEVVENKALLWAWRDVARERDRMFPVGRTDKLGRRGLFVLYNPATGRTVGTTHSFFASLGFMPAQVVDKPHRHSSNAINYALEGSFVSTVDGQTLDWEEGDLAYTAPGWSAHANGSSNRAGGTALTVQDHPFQIATECLIWQEHVDQPILLLGQQEGFQAEEAVLVG